MIVYDLDGNAHEKEPIDCRECVKEMGWSLTAPAPEVVAETPDAEPEKESGAQDTAPEVAEEAPAPEVKKGR
jgi:hypothetical protein